MAHLVVFILDNLEQYPHILDAWDEAGVPGITILESTGLRQMQGLLRDDVPLLPSLRDLLISQELPHRTLFSVIEDEDTLERVIAATERAVGDFSRHHSGLLFVLPVTRVLGLDKKEPEEPSSSST
jgi:nitrogen regulatory protein PII